MEKQTPLPPEIKDEAARRPKRAIYPSLIWGGGVVLIFRLFWRLDQILKFRREPTDPLD